MSQTLRVVVFDNQMPYSNYNEKTSKYEGFYVEIWEKIAQKSNISYKYIRSQKNDQSEDIIYKINQGLYDIGVGSFSIFTKNIDLVTFSRPIRISSYYIFKINDTSFLKNFFSKTFYLALMISFILYALLFLMYWIFSGIPFMTSFYLYFILFFNRGLNTMEFQNYTSIKIVNSIVILFSFIFFNFIIFNIVHSVFNNPESYISEKEMKSIPKLYEVRHSAVSFFSMDELKYKTVLLPNFEELEIRMKASNGYSLLDIDYLNYHLPKKEYITTRKPLIKDENAFPINNKFAFKINGKKSLVEKINESIVILQDNKEIIQHCKSYGFDIHSCDL